MFARAVFSVFRGCGTNGAVRAVSKWGMSWLGSGAEGDR